MSILLHGAKFSNQILPQEKCVSRNNFGVFSELSLLKMGFWSTNIKNFITFSVTHWVSFCMESLKRKHKSFQKGLIWQKTTLFPDFFSGNLPLVN